MKEKLRYITNNMKSYRFKYGYTQEKMAELIGVSRATYNEYEVNPQNVKIETFKKMADILNCDISDFFIQTEVTSSDINCKSELKKGY